MAEPTLQPLTNDPKREAIDAARGYSYQILRSIEVWLDLADGEILVLEGAEDIDRIAEAGAEVEQIKDTAGSGNITLRSGSVLDAIGNYWQHLDRNTGISIRFRYLTTSGIGREQHTPFGVSVPGLTLWQQIGQAPGAPESLSHASAIAAFLANQEQLSPSIRAFLSNGSTADIIMRLIEPMQWITGYGDKDALIKSIERKLILLGAGRGLAAEDAAGALGQLHLFAWNAATTPDRKPLTRATLLSCFDGATRISVPKAHLAALMGQALQLQGGDAGGVVVSREAVLERRPLLPPRFFRRGALEQSIEAQVGRAPTVIQGATGVGKTTLAAAVTESYGVTGWLNLRDLDTAVVRARLDQVQGYLETQGTRLCLVLDDLDAGADPRRLEAPLAAIAAVQRKLGGYIVITCGQDLSPRLATALDLTADATIRVLPFDRDEIAAFLIAEGCPTQRTPVLAGLIELATQGHPQLVHARVATLQATGFTVPELDSLLATPPDILDVRTEARRLVAELPSPERELLYRASLVTGRLTRARLIAISRLKEPIDEPGNAIDHLLGPWIEYADEDEYRISPLVRGSAEAVHGLDWTKKMHGQIAWAYLVDRSLTPFDVSAILMHSVISGSAGPLAQMLPSLLSAREEVWTGLAEACGMFTIVGLGEGVDPPFRKSIDLGVFRTLQYRIAIEKEPATAAKIVDRFDRESSGLEQDPRAGFFRFLFLSQQLQQTKILSEVSDLVRRGEEFIRLGDTINATYPERAAAAGIEPTTGDHRHDVAVFLSAQLMLGIISQARLTEFLEALETLDPPIARRVLSAWAGTTEQAGLVLDRIWLNEIRHDAPDWLGLRDLLVRTSSVADKLSVPELGAMIGPLLVRMIDENLGDGAAALATAQVYEEALGPDPALRAATAKVRWRAGELPQALAIWTEALPRWQPRKGSLSCVSGYRDAGMVAARLGRWDVATAMFTDGLALLAPDATETWRIGLTLDIGHAMMMNGRKVDAVRMLGSAVSALEPLEPISQSEPVLSLQKRAGAMIAALNQWREGSIDDEAIAQYAGVCSVLDPIVWDGLYATPTDFIILDLVRLEQSVDDALGLTRHYLPRLRRTRYAMLRAFIADIAFTDAMDRLDFDTLVSDGLMQIKAFAIGKAARDSGERFPEHDDAEARYILIAGVCDFLVARVIASLFALAARSNVQDVPVGRWRADIPADAAFEPLLQRLAEIETLMFDVDDPWSAIGARPESTWRLIGTVAVIARQPLSPERTLICHAAWFSYLMVQPYRDYCARDVAQLVADRWERICRTPAQLVSPRLSIPPIEAAIRSSAVGWDKTLAILLAATGAIDRASGTAIRARLKEAAA